MVSRLRFVSIPGLSPTLSAAALLAAALSLCPIVSAQAPASGANDSKIQAEVAKGLGKKQFAGVQVAVSIGVVDLTGSVKLFADKVLPKLKG